MNEKAWSGRFKESNDPIFEKMNRSLPYDIRLYKEDIFLNRIYSRELNRIGIINDEELENIEKGLTELEKEISEKGLSLFSPEIEDIHMGIETLLSKKIGEAAKKMHSGKSRNDQVSTDVRLYLKREVDEILNLIKKIMENLVLLAERNFDVVMPGYTHLRQAQPVLFSHYILSFFFSLERDYQRLCDSLKRVDILPLGSAALAGSAYPLDRNRLKKELGFSKISDNSIDSVLSRDFILEVLSDLTILSINLSRLAEDFIIYSSEHFNFFILSDKVTTGSSIMPNKKNPDSLELVRAKTGRIIGNLVALLVVLKALPTAYNKDLQEDKERLFDTIDTIKDILSVTIIILQTLELNKKVMKNSIDSFSFATELADYLAFKNVPFRVAHQVVGKIVLDCLENNKKLNTLKEIDLKKYHTGFEGIGDNWASVNKFLKKRNIHGGTGKNAVKKEIKHAKKILSTL